jgi:hypothetical protein
MRTLVALLFLSLAATAFADDYKVKVQSDVPGGGYELKILEVRQDAEELHVLAKVRRMGGGITIILRVGAEVSVEVDRKPKKQISYIAAKLCGTNYEMVGEIVKVAVAEYPKHAAAIAEQAVAGSPNSTTEIRNALNSALGDF